MVLNDLSNRYEGFGSYRDHVNFAVNAASVDVGDLAAFLSAAVATWRSYSDPSLRPSNWTAVQRQFKLDYPFAGVILAPIRSAVELFLSSPGPSTFAPVYQFLSFPVHLTLVDIQMDAILESEYIGREQELARFTPDLVLVKYLNEIMRDWLRDFRVEPNTFVPKHGPGGVAELQGDVSWYSKYKLVQPDPMMRYVFKRYAGLDVDEYAPYGDGRETTRQSRIVFVPKSMKTKRVISMEPATLMYFQQGVDAQIREYVRGHRYLSARIDFNNQSKQREAAIRASRERDMATVDLSAASDTISYDLVKRVFHGTALYPFLVALRSRSTVLPSGKVVALTKYAPMGSSLTFPIETLLFACIVECAERYVKRNTGISDFRFRVYGDDIIVPNLSLDRTVSFLERSGFSINRDKTYADEARFRESCGCDAYDGVDVTPMRISRRFSARRAASRTPGVFAALVDMANNAYVHQFWLLRRYVIHKLLYKDSGELSAYIPLFSGDARYGLLSTEPTNFLTTRRWNEGLQRFERRAATVVSYRSVASPSVAWNSDRKAFEDGCVRPVDFDDCRYFEWLRAAYQRSIDSQVHHFPIGKMDELDGDIVNDHRSYVGSTGTSLSRRWLNDPPE